MASKNDLQAAKKLMAYIEEKGYKAYIVGGYARDMMLRRPSHDVDIATNAPFSLLKQFQSADISKNKETDIIEVKYDGRKLEVARLLDGDIEKDLNRRDFTINALAMDKDNKIVGNRSHIDDIKNRNDINEIIQKKGI